MTATDQAGAKELRSFGLMVGGVFMLIAVWPSLLRGEMPRWWALAIGVPLVLLGLLLPIALGPVHRIWMTIGHALGWFNTRVLLGVIFYGMFAPMGVAMRVFGRDSMRRAFDQKSTTYRVERMPRPPSHLKRQF